VVKDILHALDPEQYERIENLVSAIKGPNKGKPKCFGTRCNDDTQDTTSDSNEKPLKIQDVLQALDPEKYDQLVGIIDAIDESNKDGNSKSTSSNGGRPANIGSDRRPANIGSNRRPANIGSERRPANIGSNRRPANIGSERRPANIGSNRRPANIGSERRPANVGSRDNSPKSSENINTANKQNRPLEIEPCHIRTKRAPGKVKSCEQSGSKSKKSQIIKTWCSTTR
jgi:hypothetical protein